MIFIPEYEFSNEEGGKVSSDMWFILLAQQLTVIKNTVFFFTQQTCHQKIK
jgi:hypothetical protein